MPATPPTSADLAAALAQVRFSCDLASAAAFLASPVSCIPGPGAGARSGRLWVRDVEVGCGSSLRAVAKAAAGAAAAAHTDTDAYLNLVADPATWFKVIWTGTRRQVAGPSLLWGTPRVWAEDGVRPAQVAAYVHHARSGLVGAPPALIDSGTPFLVDARGADVVLRGVDVDGSAPRGSLVALAEQVAETLGCAAVASVPSTVPAAEADVAGRVVSVTLRAWLPGAAGPRLVRTRVRVLEDGWEFVDAVDPVPGPVWELNTGYDPVAGGRRGESPAVAEPWVPATGRRWVHRGTGAQVDEVR